MSRTFVIGDIHGAWRALEQLIRRIEPKKNDQLIFLGDYIDGWSESARVIAYLLELETIHDCIFLKGNHDGWAEEWLKSGNIDQEWLSHGAESTLNSYQSSTSEERQKHLAFFNRLKNYYIDDLNRLFIHAGFSSMHGPGKERYESNVMWDRTLLEMALAMDKTIPADATLFPKRLLLYKEIYIGHTPTLNYGSETPMRAQNVWNIDTGAASAGRLSAMDVETKQYWQSDMVQNLYPDEKGRNK